jgi:hypothetical protein
MIRQVGSTVIGRTHRASCHCGAVVLELDLPDGIVDARRCNCSLCRRKGAVDGCGHSRQPGSAWPAHRGEDALEDARRGRRTARHCDIHRDHI